MQPTEAYLSSSDGYTIFSFGTHVIRFLAPYSLEKYTEVKEWDKGYIVVMAKYMHNIDEEEEYIDLVPILEDLYFDPDEVIKPIESVRVVYD